MLQFKLHNQTYQENQNPLLEKVSVREPSADLVFEIRDNDDVQGELSLSLLHILRLCFDNQWLTWILNGKSYDGLR